jgi:NMD protein affecting ribosome stability and mRNA decay
VLVTLPPYLKGDVVLVDGSVLLVRSTKGKEVNCIDLVDGKKRSFELSRKRASLVCQKRELSETTVSKVRPCLEVLDPVTFESVSLQNEGFLKAVLPEKKLRVGKKVHVALHDGVWFIN